jgi:hypothetical protein
MSLLSSPLPWISVATRWSAILAVLVLGCSREPAASPTPAPALPDEPPADIVRSPSVPPPRPPPPDGIRVLERDAITLALSRDGTFLAAGDLAGNALLWDLSRERFLWRDATPEGNRLGRVVFAADAPIYLAGSFHEPDRPWRAWSAEPQERRGELGEAGWIGVDAALDDPGRRALTLSSSPDGEHQRLELWDLGATRALASVPLRAAGRGAVALAADGRRFAVSDDNGAVVVYAPSDTAEDAPIEVFRSEVQGGPDEDRRVARLELSADGTILYGASAARLFTWGLGGPGEEPTSRSTVVGAAGGDPHPIRGLHRASREDGVSLLVVTRPVSGGLEIFGADGGDFGHLDTGCRCESHALSADGAVAACGCVEASELRWGKVTRAASAPE